MYEPEERSSLSSRIPYVLGAIVAAAVVIAIAVFVLDVGGGGGSGNKAAAVPTVAPSPTQAGSTPEELALGAYVQSNLKSTYTGDCAKAAAAPATTGQAPAGQTPAAAASGISGATGVPAANPASSLCSTKRGDRQGAEAYVLGPSQANTTEWAFLEQQNGAWQVTQITPITPANSVVPGTPWPLKQGAEVIVTGTGACLNVRTEPKVDPGNAVDCIADGTKIKLAAGPTDAGGIQWWQVDGRAGWVAADYLRYEDAAQ
ncbi:MAG TPA: SH3 domain-containing protein [Dehalococcoidia bacterium]|nr:SH3 domain-containing protein [Dehalococcoidia bacterium]